MRGRPGCPTEQEKKPVGATVSNPLFYKERLGTGSPPHPTRLRRPTFPPRGRLCAVLPFPSAKPPPPARPAGGRAVTGVRYRAAGQAEKKRGPPQGPPKLEKVGPGRKNLFLPGVLSPGFLPKKAGLPRGRRRGTHVAGSTLQRFQRNCLPMTEAPRPHLAACGQVPSGKWAQKPPRPVGVWGA